MPILNILNGGSLDRSQILTKELERQGIHDYKLWDGIHDTSSVKKSINLSHKQIVAWAWQNDLDEVFIAENDFKGTHQDSWDYFLMNKPKEFDLYLGGIFLGDLYGNVVYDFTGLTMYVVSKKFYATFLNTPDDEHLDRALAHLGNYIVCNPFAFVQHEGVSHNTGKFESYDSLFQNRQLYNG